MVDRRRAGRAVRSRAEHGGAIDLVPNNVVRLPSYNPLVRTTCGSFPIVDGLHRAILRMLKEL
jgi:hypothetical protein